MKWSSVVVFLCHTRLFLRILLYGSNTFSRPAINACKPGVLFALLGGDERRSGVMPPFSWSRSWSLFGWWFRHVPHTVDLLRPHDAIVRWLTRRHLMPHQLGSPAD